MSSLQDQLLKAGLVDQKKVAQANREKNRKENLTRRSGGKKKAASPPRQKVPGKKQQRDRELNQKRQEAARLKELATQARQLIDNNKENRAGGEHPYSFVYKSKVKKIFVTEAQKQQLIKGRLMIATYVVNNDGRKFDLVPAAVGEKIAQRDATFIVETRPQEESGEAADDSYADYIVPDDLTW